MPTQEQLQKLWDLSDTKLYSEAKDFISDLADELIAADPNIQDRSLPENQMHGLRDVIAHNAYGQLRKFIIHQRGRDWKFSQQKIKTFYKNLDDKLEGIKHDRLIQEFHLIDENSLVWQKKSKKEREQEKNTLMLYIASEFIQHALFENELLKKKEEERKEAEKKQQTNNQSNNNYRQRNQSSRWSGSEQYWRTSEGGRER
jgi:hypothetical protein